MVHSDDPFLAGVFQKFLQPDCLSLHLHIAVQRDDADILIIHVIDCFLQSLGTIGRKCKLGLPLYRKTSLSQTGFCRVFRPVLMIAGCWHRWDHAVDKSACGKPLMPFLFAVGTVDQVAGMDEKLCFRRSLETFPNDSGPKLKHVILGISHIEEGKLLVQIFRSCFKLKPFAPSLSISNPIAIDRTWFQIFKFHRMVVRFYIGAFQ